MKKSQLLLSAFIILMPGLQVVGQAPFYPRPHIDNDKVFNRHAPISQSGKARHGADVANPSADLSSARIISPSEFFKQSRNLPRSASQRYPSIETRLSPVTKEKPPAASTSLRTSTPTRQAATPVTTISTTTNRASPN